MPKMVTIGPSDTFKAKGSQEEKAAANASFKAIKKAGKVRVSYQTALQNVRNSGGMYEIYPDKEPRKVQVETDLNDMEPGELKVMMMNLGVKTEKQMKKSDVISLIKRKLGEVEIIDDDDEPGEQSS